MKLMQLLDSARGAGVALGASGDDLASIEIAAVTDDSRRAGPGSLFVAREGTKGDGAAFIGDAVARGAVAVAGTAESLRPIEGRSVARIETSTPALALAALAQALHGWPSRAMPVVGVTGTNGKTTITYLVRQILESAGRRCGLMGTVEIHDGRAARTASLTTPGADELAAALGSMVRHGCTGAAIEVSSHALAQGRAAGVDFAAAIFTNLTGDHLDYHGSMEAYADAKALLFDGLAPTATAIVNADDPAHERMLRKCRARVIRCRRIAGGTDRRPGADRSPSADRAVRAADRSEGAGTDASVEILRCSLTGAEVVLAGPWGRIEASLPLAGAHNAMNALQAVAAAHALGVDPSAIARALPALHAPPGRLESVTGPESPFQVLVDYAHSDDALENVLAAIRPLVTGGGRVITVFGCGGDRDRTKRPRMAATACRHSDLVVVTSDNPRTEEPESIIDEIMSGVPASERPRVRRDADRERAIHAAIREARRGDVVLIAGKGHEDYQIVGTTKRHFDDRLVARRAIGDAP